MAIGTLGTNANNSLAATPAFTKALSIADYAAIANNIRDDQNVSAPIYPGAFAPAGMLFIPNRGILRVLDGDVVAYDSTGWPILISSKARTSGPWTLV